MQTFFLIAGIIILFVTSFDFFYTTLSGSGAFFLTQKVYAIIHQLQLIIFKKVGRNVFKLSGILINLGILSIWILLIWFSLFFIYSSNPEAIVNTKGEVANTIERLYFTGYTLSTLGMGNFNPDNSFFQLLTSIFSFFGFIFLTTSITYLVSVFSGVRHKRTLSLMLTKLGSTPSEAVRRFVEQDSTFTYQQILLMQQIIDQHSATYQAYPVLHYYINSDEESSLSVHLTILDESISILLSSSKEYTFKKELIPLRKSINDFLKQLQEKFKLVEKSDGVVRIDWSGLQLPDDFLQREIDENDLKYRRKILSGLLATEGFTWKNIYPEKVLSNH